MPPFQVKSLKAQIEKKKVLKGKVEVKKSQIEVFNRDNKPKDLTKEKEVLEIKKTKLIAEDVKFANQLTKNLIETGKVRKKIELLQISSGVIQKTEQRLRNELNDDKEELVTVQENFGEQEDITRKASEVYVKQISTAQDITGDDYKGKI